MVRLQNNCQVTAHLCYIL
uniref:Uncharacterized protein n=1 Tax=Rhizophora mucronata TaxID=61149 RepID=A0A2P2QN19_RHIMU